MNNVDPTGLILGVDDFSAEELAGTVLDAVAGAAVCTFATASATAIGTAVAGTAAGATCAAGTVTTTVYGLGDTFDEDDEWRVGE